MPYDSKYGRVTTERGTIGEDEPVIIFRAQDMFALTVIDFYRGMCLGNGTDEQHIEAIDRARGVLGKWRAEHSDRVKLPDTLPNL